jgi:hypothetical protein
MDTKLPVFREAAEPLEVNEWLNSIEQRFRLLGTTEDLKTEFGGLIITPLFMPMCQ